MGKAVYARSALCPSCVVSKGGLEQEALLKSVENSNPSEVVGLDNMSLGRPDNVYLYIFPDTGLNLESAIPLPACSSDLRSSSFSLTPLLSAYFLHYNFTVCFTVLHL